jgi:hypothetical protein
MFHRANKAHTMIPSRRTPIMSYLAGKGRSLGSGVPRSALVNGKNTFRLDDGAVNNPPQGRSAGDSW